MADFITPDGIRIGTVQHLYYEMSEAAYLSHVHAAAQAAQQPVTDDELPAHSDADRVALSAAINTIVFAGMCLEAAIYDYAAWHLPTSTAEVLDKLDFVSKWRIVPLVITGRSLPEGTTAHQALSALSRLRNALVHAKSRAVTSGADIAKAVDDAAARERNVRSGAAEAMNAIILTSMECERLFGNTMNPLPSFTSHLSGVSRPIPAELRPLVARCRGIIDRASNIAAD